MWRYNPSVSAYYNNIAHGKTNYTHKHFCVYVCMCICVFVCGWSHNHLCVDVFLHI